MIKENWYEELYERAARGIISDEEIALVVSELQKPNPEADPYTLLSILGYTDAISYRHVVEHFLEGPDDFAAKKALSVLCLNWNLSADYTDQMLTLLQSVSWNESEDCRGMAALCAGVHLKQHVAPQLLSRLIGIVENENESSYLRLSAYEALVEATGGDTRWVPLRTIDFSPHVSIDPDVLKKAQNRLLQETVP